MAGLHPCARDYLARLPDGLDSHPHCVAKAALLRDVLGSRALDPDGDHLPDPLRSLVATPPPVSSWIPEVHFVAISLAIYGRHFADHDLQAFEEWVCARNMALFSKPLYRVLIALMSPERLLVGASKRWTAFHRGTTLTLLEHTPEYALVRLDFPPHLFERVLMHGFAASMRAAAQVAGGRNVRSGLDTATPTRAEYWVRWQ
jgi:hypothetical protein